MDSCTDRETDVKEVKNVKVEKEFRKTYRQTKERVKCLEEKRQRNRR
jgi:hypothetical protein